MADITKDQYEEAKGIMIAYKRQELEILNAPQKICECTDCYRYWYTESTLVERCRNCFKESESEERPFLLEDYNELTSGKYKMNEEDTKKYREYINKREALRNSLFKLQNM